MKKRVLTLFLALALCLGLATPAFAETGSTVIDGAVNGGASYTLEQQDTKSSSASFVDQEITFDFDSNPPHAHGYYAITEDVVWTISNTTSDDFGVMISFSERCKEGNHYSTHNICWILSDGTFSLALKGVDHENFVLKAGQSVTFSLKDVISTMEVTANPDSLYEIEIMDSIYIGDGDSYLFKLNSSADPDVTDEEPTSSPAFTDTPDWCAKEAQWAVDKGITNGAGSADRFAPTQDCAHEQILTFLWRAAGKPAAAQAPVTVASYYQDAVNWAYEKGFIDQSLQLSDPCTRAQAVWYIWKALGEPQAAQAASFSDVDAGAHYAGAVSWAVEKGVTKGYGGEDTFAPDRVCGRGEIACFLYRAYN